MKTKLLCATWLASSVLAVSAFAPSAASALGLDPGAYNLAGAQNICLEADGTWFGEQFQFGGRWKTTRLPEDATVLFGNYAGGTGNDAIVVTDHRDVDWSEWRDGLSFSKFIDGVVTKLRRPCGRPADAPPANSTRRNPTD